MKFIKRYLSEKKARDIFDKEFEKKKLSSGSLDLWIIDLVGDLLEGKINIYILTYICLEIEALPEYHGMNNIKPINLCLGLDYKLYDTNKDELDNVKTELKSWYNSL